MGGNFYLDIRPILHSYSFSRATKLLILKLRGKAYRAWHNVPIFPRYALPIDKSQPRLPQELTIITAQIQESDTTHPTAESAIS